MEAFVLKSTGVIRRIDELGRIVIPKEIRRNLKIRDGENMEIFIDLDAIILKKYSKLDDMLSFSDKISKMINEITSYNIAITDREKIIASYGKEDFLNLKGKAISERLIDLIDTRSSLNDRNEKTIKITQDTMLGDYFLIFPLISSADCIGLVIIHSSEDLGDKAQLVAKIVNFLICEQVDIDS